MKSTPAFLDVPPRTVGLERLDLLDDDPAGVWSRVRDLVQSDLAMLDGPVRAKLPTARARTGSNRGGRAHLFVYRVYEAEPGTGIDAVVVGITVGPCPGGADDSFRVRGDIAGETLGDVLFESPSHDVVGYEAMTNAARDTGEILARESELVLAALRHGSRRD